MKRTEKYRICELAGKLSDGIIEDSEFQELEQLLSQNEDCRKWYLHCIQQNVDLDELDRFINKPLNPKLALLKTWPIMATASIVCMIVGGGIAITAMNPAVANAEQPTVEYRGDSVSLRYPDGTTAVLEQPSRFRLDGNNNLTLESGKMVAQRGERSTSKFEITVAQHTFRPQAGEFGISLEKGVPELHMFDGAGDLSSTASKRKGKKNAVAPGGIFQISAGGQLSPSLISNATKFRSRHAIVPGGFFEDFTVEQEAPSSPAGNWDSPAKGHTKWVVAETPGLTRRSGPFLSVYPGRENTDTTLYLPKGTERREVTGALTRLSRQYHSTDTVSLDQPHTIEFLFRLDSDPRDLHRIAIFDGSRDLEMEPLVGDRSWHIHAGTPALIQNDNEFVWFLRDTTLDEGYQIMKIEQGRTYRISIAVTPQQRRFRSTISDGVNVVYNNRRRRLPRFGKDQDSINGVIHLFAYAKSGKESRFSIDEIIIRNAPIAQNPES